MVRLINDRIVIDTPHYIYYGTIEHLDCGYYFHIIKILDKSTAGFMPIYVIHNSILFTHYNIDVVCFFKNTIGYYNRLHKSDYPWCLTQMDVLKTLKAFDKLVNCDKHFIDITYYG